MPEVPEPDEPEEGEIDPPDPEARLSQLRIEAPAGEGQPYTGLHIARDGAWWNAGVHVLG